MIKLVEVGGSKMAFYRIKGTHLSFEAFYKIILLPKGCQSQKLVKFFAFTASNTIYLVSEIPW